MLANLNSAGAHTQPAAKFYEFHTEWAACPLSADALSCTRAAKASDVCGSGPGSPPPHCLLLPSNAVIIRQILCRMSCSPALVLLHPNAAAKGNSGAPQCLLEEDQSQATQTMHLRTYCISCLFFLDLHGSPSPLPKQSLALLHHVLSPVYHDQPNIDYLVPCTHAVAFFQYFFQSLFGSADFMLAVSNVHLHPLHTPPIARLHSKFAAPDLGQVPIWVAIGRIVTANNKYQISELLYSERARLFSAEWRAWSAKCKAAGYNSQMRTDMAVKQRVSALHCYRPGLGGCSHRYRRLEYERLANDLSNSLAAVRGCGCGWQYGCCYQLLVILRWPTHSVSSTGVSQWTAIFI